MNIEKALKHFDFKFKNSKKVPSPSDLEAFNAILDYKEKQQSANLQQNETLAKLFIFTLIRINSTRGYSAKQCLKQIDDIFRISVFEWVKQLRLNYFFTKFNVTKEAYEGYLEANYGYNITQLDIEGKKIFKEHPELLECEIPDIEYYIKFVEEQMNRIINENER